MEDNLDNLAKELARERDRLENDVKTAAQNNMNMKYEIKELRTRLIEAIIEPMKIKRRIERKKSYIRRISAEMQSILGSYLSHLKVLLNELRDESELDWKMVQEGEFESYEEFLDTFIDHRKDYHLYKAKAKRLAKDLQLLDNIPPARRAVKSSHNTFDGV